MPPNSSGRFPTTAWSIVRKAKDRHSPEYVTSMNRFITGYWRPVFYFLRTRGYPLQQAEDLTQGFFVKCLEEGCVAGADPQKGRFRTYLLTILNRFLADQRPPRATKQKAFDDRLVAVSALMGENERQFEPPSGATPDQVFMKQWAHSLVDTVQRRLEQWCHHQGRPDWYQVFVAYHFPPPGSRKVSQQALAERFKLSRDQVRHALDRTNDQFIEFFRAEVGEQVDSTAEVDAEIREIRSLL